ncbi:MAG: hypothetical protein UX89_C0007G0030 [Parcubacteria group bacterium GW2011_GWA2_47_16]|nr:MAG: hypothetical protein UX89_C0007G0030 [Parcubacteria group bacterium GW2011_GWA2_47_16]
MTWHLFSKTPEMKVGVVLDIGSKSVAGAVFIPSPSGKPRILYATREKLFFRKNITGGELSSSMIKALDLILFHLNKYGVEHLRRTGIRYTVESVDAVVSSPWNASETKVLTLKFSQRSLITEAVIEELISSEEKSFEKRFEGTAVEELTHELLERKILEMRLNGYPTGKPYGKWASELEIRMFSSIISSSTLQKMKKLIAKSFSEVVPRFHTFSAVAFTSLRDLFPEIQNFLIVQVGGEVSDIAIIKRGVITEVASAPCGHNSLIRAFGKICENHPECTLEGLIKIHGEVGIQTTEQKKVEVAVAETKAVWLDHFNTAISNFSEETFLPKVVFLLEERPYTSLFEVFLKEAESSQFTATAEPFVINTIDESMASTFAEFDKNVLPDEVLALEAGFTSKM